MDTMYFSWLPEAVEVADDLEMPQFTLQKHELNDCSQSYTAGTSTQPPTLTGTGNEQVTVQRQGVVLQRKATGTGSSSIFVVTLSDRILGGIALATQAVPPIHTRFP